jgi:hypothetical protein
MTALVFPFDFGVIESSELGIIDFALKVGFSN